MKKFRPLIGIFSVAFFVFAMSACCALKRSVHNERDVYEKIGQAQAFFNGAEKYKDVYPDEFRQTEENLNKARIQAEKCNRDEAFSNAADSVELSDQILKKAAGDTRKQAEKQKEEVKEIVKNFPDTSLQDLLSELDEIIEYAKEIENKRQNLSLDDIGKIQNGRGKTEIAKGTLESLRQETIASDVSFSIGKYKIADMSDKGKQNLKRTVKGIIDAKNAYLKGITNKKGSLTVRIETLGYTDELPFAEGTKLVKELERGTTRVSRTHSEKRRKALNMNLSYFRAETIGNYIKHLLETEDNNLTVQTQPIGYGEERMPPNVDEPYPTDDSRRRVCIINSYCLFTEDVSK